ncbi:MAG: hypothetical protein QHC81_01080 [Achromobacter sp.]|nr:hypothetical protein [Achromobacter sp.]
MDKYRREREHDILAAAVAAHPDWLICKDGVADHAAADAYPEIRYLEGHGLLDVREPQYAEWPREAVSIRATSRAIDFLANDGGLSAILGVVTVKLHDDTIKALIESKILASDLLPPDKQRYLARLRSLPADATRHVVMKLVDLGLDKSPDAISWLGKWFDSLPPT